MPRGHFYLPSIGLSCSCHARQAPRVNWVLDIGEALDTLGGILKRYNFQNLDELFPGENTTTEFMCKVGVGGFHAARCWESLTGLMGRGMV